MTTMIAAQEFLTVYRNGRVRRLRLEAHPRLQDVTQWDAHHPWTRARDDRGRAGYARPAATTRTTAPSIANGLPYLFVPDDGEALVLMDFALTFSVSQLERQQRREERQRSRRRRARKRAA